MWKWVQKNKRLLFNGLNILHSIGNFIAHRFRRVKMSWLVAKYVFWYHYNERCIIVNWHVKFQDSSLRNPKMHHANGQPLFSSRLYYWYLSYQLLCLYSGTSSVVKYSVCSCKLLLLCLGTAEAVCEKSPNAKSDGTPESIALTLAEFIVGCRCIIYPYSFNGMSTGDFKTFILINLQKWTLFVNTSENSILVLI
jgi:hypothetical protein